ncbi:MAG: protein-L-isoaspartate O-methyltransferase [Thermoprotei archaeon]|nr:MAG: protein-L-isoaspartate O-methyltransferase [Thermoprotei archaeon]
MPRRFEHLRSALVRMLELEGVIKSPLVREAMLSVPREEFVPQHLRDYAYQDTPLPIGYGQTISAPHMVALMTEELRVEPGHRVLEVGTGSGYQAAILAHIVSKKLRGHVVTIERIPGLADFAKKNLERVGLYHYVTIIVGDGSIGAPQYAPFDRIIVTAAAPKIPQSLVKQLRPGGRLVIPVGDRWSQVLVTVTKQSDGTIHTEYGTPCVFVPLVGCEGWREEERYIT